MLANTKNATPTVTTAIVTGADMLRHVIIAGKSTHTAALELCYASAAFILLVNHFQDTKSKEYMTKSDAVDYLCKQIKDQAGVQGGMLDLYIRNASRLVGILTGSLKMFGPTIQKLGLAKTSEEMVSILSHWMDENKGKRIESMSSLSEALGFKTGRPTGAATKAENMTTEQSVAKAENAIKAIEKAVSNGKTRESAVAKAIVSNAKSALVFAREAIKRITEIEDLKAIELAVAEQRKTLADLAEKAKESVAVRTKQHAETVARHKQHGKGEKRGQRQPVRTEV